MISEEQKKLLRETRRARSAAYRALDATFRDASSMMDAMLEGLCFSQRASVVTISDYSWRRARKMCIATGVLDERGNLTTRDGSAISRLLEVEYRRQESNIERGKPPAYLGLPVNKKGKGS